MLQQGESVPHFVVRTLQGETVDYSTIWQNRNLVLVVLDPADPDASRYVSALESHAADLQRLEAVAVATRDHLAGMPAPAVLVADRWGEIAHAAAAERVAALPPVDDLLEWLHYTQIRCAECEGEAK